MNQGKGPGSKKTGISILSSPGRCHILSIRKIIESKLGYYFVAIREDQDAADHSASILPFTKPIALCISGLAHRTCRGLLYQLHGLHRPKVVFALHDISIVAIMVVMVGGVATYWGPVVGSLIMIMLAEAIRSIPKLGAAHHTFFLASC